MSFAGFCLPQSKSLSLLPIFAIFRRPFDPLLTKNSPFNPSMSGLAPILFQIQDITHRFTRYVSQKQMREFYGWDSLCFEISGGGTGWCVALCQDRDCSRRYKNCSTSFYSFISTKFCAISFQKDSLIWMMGVASLSREYSRTHRWRSLRFPNYTIGMGMCARLRKS
jgi:hypothetical protein